MDKFKVLCIKKEFFFTEGNIYDMEYEPGYRINTDRYCSIYLGGISKGKLGYEKYEFDEQFILLSEWREQQINQILNG